MKDLLRSIFIVQNEPPDVLTEHFHALDASGLSFDIPEDQTIYDFCKDFILAQHHPPHVSTLRGHFERNRELTVVDRLEEVMLTKPILTKGDFEFQVNLRSEERRKRIVSTLLKEAEEILTRGLVKQEKGKPSEVILGPHAAMQYLMDKAHDVMTPITGNRLSGEVTGDAEDFLAEYQRVKADPLAGLGQMTGFKEIDETLKGAKKQELWIHAAFTGGGKSTFMLNWVYNQAVYYGHDCLIFSLEMPYVQCRRKLYSIHSTNEKFKAMGWPPIDYGRIRDGLLSDKEEDMLRVIAEDFNTGGYGKIYIEVADPSKIDFTVADMRHRAEVIYAKSPFKMLFVDHALLMGSRGKYSNTTDKINEVIRDCKKLSMSFNKGMGMAVVLLFQISREGYRAAQKARGVGMGENATKSNHVYNLTTLSYANEAERSSDVVTATYIDEELSGNNQILMQCLKSRDNKPFEPMLVGIHWPTQRMTSLNGLTAAEAAGVGASIDTGVAALMDDQG